MIAKCFAMLVPLLVPLTVATPCVSGPWSFAVGTGDADEVALAAAAGPDGTVLELIEPPT